MRADEGPLLRALARKIQAGEVQDIPAESRIINSGPAVKWIVCSRQDCWKIARLLDGTPLYAKKQREYDLWRKALSVWTATPRGNRWHGPRDNSAMESLWAEMKTLRPFDQDLADSDFDPLRQPDYLFHYRWAKSCLIAAKPGAHLLAFGGTRTHHRLVCAIEDAGWEIRDTVGWMYGSGFPKSLDVSKAIDKEAGAEREVMGVVRVNSDSERVAMDERPGRGKVAFGNPVQFSTAPATDSAKQWDGWGTALKPAWEPICLARKPLKGTVAQNVQRYGTGAINIDGCRVTDGTETGGRKPQYTANMANKVYGTAMGGGAWENTQGRFPANLIHDGSDEVLELFPGEGDKSAARFFYCAKASRKERGAGNKHPTVKPTALMRYLVRLITPPNGIVFDPFMGSGTTGLACIDEGFRFIGAELDKESFDTAVNRLLTPR